MLAQVKKLAGDDLAGRFSAWWNGRDYVPPPPADAPPTSAPTTGAATSSPPLLALPAPPTAPRADKRETAALLSPEEAAAVRIRALESLWGEGRLGPGGFRLDRAMVDALLELTDQPGDIGFLGVDGALLTAFIAQSDRRPVVSEWRPACVPRLQQLVPSAAVVSGEVDRPRSFADGSLKAVASVEAFAYADHKAGLVARIHRALDARGRWVFLDTTRRTSKTPPQAFASAWSEPQLATASEIEELLTLAGFPSVRRVSAAEHLLAAERQAHVNLLQVLDKASTNGYPGRDGALFLQEVAWEAQSWRARARAITGGALEVNLWVADKTEQKAPLDLALDQIVRPDDAGAANALFD